MWVAILVDVFAWGNSVVNADFQNSFPCSSLPQLLIDATGCSNQCNMVTFSQELISKELIILCLIHSQLLCVASQANRILDLLLPKASSEAQYPY